MAAFRRPAEIKDGEDMKCAMNPEAGCNDRCLPQDSGNVVLSGGDSAGISTENFCLLECKMIDTVPGSQCVDLGKKDTLKQVTSGGNGDDAALPPDVKMVKGLPDDPYNPPAGSKSKKEKPEGENAAAEKLHELKIATDYAHVPACGAVRT